MIFVVQSTPFIYFLRYFLFPLKYRRYNNVKFEPLWFVLSFITLHSK